VSVFRIAYGDYSGQSENREAGFGKCNTYLVEKLRFGGGAVPAKVTIRALHRSDRGARVADVPFRAQHRLPKWLQLHGFTATQSELAIHDELVRDLRHAVPKRLVVLRAFRGTDETRVTRHAQGFVRGASEWRPRTHRAVSTRDAVSQRTRGAATANSGLVRPVHRALVPGGAG
jgi:hypothetical protein